MLCISYLNAAAMRTSEVYSYVRLTINALMGIHPKKSDKNKDVETKCGWGSVKVIMKKMWGSRGQEQKNTHSGAFAFSRRAR
jgi:hypothetical protein